MKKLFLVLLVVFITGCKEDAHVIPSWPDVPKELLEACPDLKTIDPKNDKLSQILDVVTDNYKEYYDCKDKVDDWIKWYNGNKKIHESVK